MYAMLRKAMSMSPLIVLATGLVWGVPAVAQAPKANDLLDQVRRQNELAAQKMDAEVREALADSQKLLASDPVKAIEVLKKVLTRLEADTVLTQTKRDTFVKTVKERIRTAQAADAPKAADRLKEADTKRAQALARAAEQDKINFKLATIAALQKEGKLTDASKLAEELVKEYPELVPAQLAKQNNSVLDQVTALRSLRTQAAGRVVAGLTSVDRSNLLPAGDVEFPKDWKEKVERRKDTTNPLTEKEKAVLRSLNTVLPSVTYKEARFEDVLQDLSDKMGVPILVDKSALGEAMVNPSETPVSLPTIKGVTARTILHKVLADFGLTYIVKNETIQVVTQEQAKATMITRTYPLGALVAGGGFADAGIRFNPWIDRFQAMQNVMNIVGMIQSTVDPQSWQANGGTGTIAFHAPSMSLVIRNTAEVHGMLGGSGR